MANEVLETTHPGSEASIASPREKKTWGYRGLDTNLTGWIPKLASSTGRFGDAVIFGIFAIAGLLAELVTHTFTGNTLLIIAGPVAVLLFYLVTGLVFRRFRLRLDQLGDNCYYLGFLFTLTALSIALYDFRGMDVEIGTIVSNFGVALASTILGVLLRVLLSQMREDPIEVEEQSRYELAQASAMLKDELYASVRDMNSFRGVIQQSIVESFEDVNLKSKESILRAAEELSEAARNINNEIAARNEQIGERFDQFNTEVAARNEQIGERFDRFNDLTQRSVSSLEALVNNMENVRPFSELIEVAFSKTISSMQSLAEESEKIFRLNEQQRISGEKAMAVTSASMQLVSKNLSGLTGDEGLLHKVAENLDNTTKAIGAITTEIERMSLNLANEVTTQKDNLNEYSEATANSLKLVRSFNEELKGDLQQNRGMLSEVGKNLADMAHALARAVG